MNVNMSVICTLTMMALCDASTDVYTVSQICKKLLSKFANGPTLTNTINFRYIVSNKKFNSLCMATVVSLIAYLILYLQEK